MANPTDTASSQLDPYLTKKAAGLHMAYEAIQQEHLRDLMKHGRDKNKRWTDMQLDRLQKRNNQDSPSGDDPNPEPAEPQEEDAVGNINIGDVTNHIYQNAPSQDVDASTQTTTAQPTAGAAPSTPAVAQGVKQGLGNAAKAAIIAATLLGGSGLGAGGMAVYLANKISQLAPAAPDLSGNVDTTETHLLGDQP